MLLALALFGWRLGSHDLWPTDEPRFALVAREMLQRADPVVLSLNDHQYTDKPPLLFWAIDLCALVGGGVDEWSARIPSAAAALGILLVILHLGTRLYDRRTGWLAALVFATNVQVLERARWASTDMLLSLFVLAATVLLWRACEGGTGARPAADAAWLLMGLATLTKGPVGLALPILAILPALLVVRPPGGLRRLVPPEGPPIYLAAVGAWFVPFALRLGWRVVFGIATHQTVDRYVNAWNVQHPVWYFLWRFPVGFFPWIVFLPFAFADAWRRDAGLERRAAIFLTGWFASIFLFFSFSTGKRGVYIIPLYPAAALLVARLFTRPGDDAALERPAAAPGAWRRLRQARWWALAAALLTAAAIPIAGRRYPELGVAAWTLAGAFVAAAAAGAAALRRRRPLVLAHAVAGVMAVTLLVGTEAIFPYVNRHLGMSAFAGEVRTRLSPDIPLATTEEKREAWVFYTGRFVAEVDTRQEILAWLRGGAPRDLLIEEELLRDVRDDLPPGTLELYTGQVSGRPYHLLRRAAAAPGPP